MGIEISGGISCDTAPCTKTGAARINLSHNNSPPWAGSTIPHGWAISSTGIVTCPVHTPKPAPAAAPTGKTPPPVATPATPKT